MEEKIKLLVGLQSCDLKIRDIRKKMSEGPQRVQALEEGIRALEKVAQGEAELLESRKRERRQIDQEIAAFEAKVEKSQAKLSGSKSNKEYRAALKEIDDLQREKGKFEERALELMEEIDALEKKYKARGAELQEARVKFEEDKKSVSRELDDMNVTLAEYEKEREQYSREIEGELLQRYDFLKSRKGGVAVSSVINAVCQTCHLGIPAQKFNELIRGDVLLTCPHCNRIIYWGERESFQKAAGDSE